MKKLLVFAIITLGFLMVPQAMALQSNPAPAVNVALDVKIGFLSPKTGDLAAYSDGFWNGANVALDQVKAAYPDSTFTMTLYDTKTTPEGATAAMTAAATAGSTFVVGAAGSSNTMAATEVAKTEKIPLISYASTSPVISTYADDGFLFRVVPSDAYQGGAMADIAEDAGYTTAVVLHLDNAYGTGVKDAFESAFSGKVSKAIAYDPANFEASALVDQIAAEDPDVVVAVSYATDGSKLFVQMADQRLNVPVIGGDGVADDAIFDELNGTQDAMMNLIATKPTAVSSDEVTAFEKAYADAGYSGGIYTGEAFDAVWVGVKAVMAAGSVDGTAVRDALKTVTHKGGSGYKEFDANGDIKAAAYLVMEVQTDGFKEIGTWVDGTLTLDADFTQEAAVQGTPGFELYLALAGIFIMIPILRKRKN